LPQEAHLIQNPVVVIWRVVKQHRYLCPSLQSQLHRRQMAAVAPTLTLLPLFPSLVSVQNPEVSTLG
jgi:hypothetical protein